MTTPTVLVTGGAGFVGSHTCKALAKAGYLPVVYDDLSNGVQDAVRWGPLEVGALEDEARLAAIVAQHKPVAVAHFAAFIEAGESVREPERFYRNNVAGTLALLLVMRGTGVDKHVFSWAAAVYGSPEVTPNSENYPLRPVSPSARSKLTVEEILADIALAHGLRYAALCYFNAAGADPHGELGEDHELETHLGPLVLPCANGQGPDIVVFGKGYASLDGTCIRDYVQVTDLAEVHTLALFRLFTAGESLTTNLVTGCGFSVHELVGTAGRVTGRSIPIRFADHRSGDPAVQVANASPARRDFGWVPRLPTLIDQVGHAAALIRQAYKTGIA